MVTGITIIATAAITAIGIYVSKIPDMGYKLYDGMSNLVLVGMMFGTVVIIIGGFQRRTIERLCIIEKVEKENGKE